MNIVKFRNDNEHDKNNAFQWSENEENFASEIVTTILLRFACIDVVNLRWMSGRESYKVFVDAFFIIESNRNLKFSCAKNLALLISDCVSERSKLNNTLNQFSIKNFLH